MISLSSDITDAKGRRASAGWVFFDAECPFCISVARRLLPVLVPRGFGLAPLQDPRVQELLALPANELLREMRVLTPDGRVFGGADAVIWLGKGIWWAWPFFAIAQLPGMRAAMRAAYCWVAARRNCNNGACAR